MRVRRDDPLTVTHAHARPAATTHEFNIAGDHDLRTLDTRDSTAQSPPSCCSSICLNLHAPQPNTRVDPARIPTNAHIPLSPTPQQHLVDAPRHAPHSPRIMPISPHPRFVARIIRMLQICAIPNTHALDTDDRQRMCIAHLLMRRRVRASASRPGRASCAQHSRIQTRTSTRR